MKRSMLILFGMVLATQVFAGSSPNDNRSKGEPLGTITMDPNGATAYNLDDGSSGFAPNLTLPTPASGGSINVANRSSQVTTIATTNSSLPQPLSLRANQSARFDLVSGKWVLRNNTVQNFDPNAPSGVVNVAPSFVQ